LTDFSNSAKRVLNLVLAVQNKPDQKSAAETWAEAFGLNVASSKADPHDVIQQLSLLRHELDFLEEKMSATSFNKSLFQPYVKRVRAAVTISNISASWNNYKVNLNPETILALRYCSEILDNEPTSDFDELEKVLVNLKTFRESLDRSSINGVTYEFVISQISIIERAIINYPIVGGAAIKKAFSEGFTDLNVRAENLAKEEETEVTRTVGKLWKDLKVAGNEFVEADRMANAYIGIINKGQSLAESVIAYLPGPGS